MFRRILIPTDLTDRTFNALEIAAGIGDTDDTLVTLVHVIETISGAEFDEFASFYRTLEARARGRLDEMAARWKGKGHVDVAIVYGKRAEEVLRFANANEMDLIIVPSHPVDPSEPFRGVGTMSYKLAIFAPCAVLLIKDERR